MRFSLVVSGVVLKKLKSWRWLVDLLFHFEFNSKFIIRHFQQISFLCDKKLSEARPLLACVRRHLPAPSYTLCFKDLTNCPVLSCPVLSCPIELTRTIQSDQSGQVQVSKNPLVSAQITLSTGLVKPALGISVKIQRLSMTHEQKLYLDLMTNYMLQILQFFDSLIRSSFIWPRIEI